MIGQTNPHARPLRRAATEAEQRLWHHLRNRQLADLKFRRQATIGPYIADFLCVELMLIVEADGGQHQPEADQERTAFLEARDYEVLRFWNNDVLGNTIGVLEVIAATAEERRKTLTQPSPASGRGQDQHLSREREREGRTKWEGEGALPSFSSSKQ